MFEASRYEDNSLGQGAHLYTKCPTGIWHSVFPEHSLSAKLWKKTIICKLSVLDLYNNFLTGHTGVRSLHVRWQFSRAWGGYIHQICQLDGTVLFPWAFLVRKALQTENMLWVFVYFMSTWKNSDHQHTGTKLPCMKTAPEGRVLTCKLNDPLKFHSSIFPNIPCPSSFIHTNKKTKHSTFFPFLENFARFL